MVHVLRAAQKRNNLSRGAGEAKEVFAGKLVSENGEFTYTDPLQMEPATTYEYWVSPDGKNLRCASARVRERHPEIWWSVDRIQETTREIAEKYPDLVRMEQVGETVKGRPLYALFAGNAEKYVVLVGSMHVAESGPEQILPAFEGVVRDNPELLSKIGLAALPCVTLDERDRMLTEGVAKYMRLNVNRVDLNRNFTEFTGDDPTDKNQQRKYKPALSEPETQAVAALLDKAHPAAVFSYHSIGSLASADFVRANEIVFEGDDQFLDICEAVARTYSEGMYTGEAEKYWSIAQPKGWQGRLPTYVYQNFKAPAYDLELDRREEPRAVVYADLLTPEMLKEYQVRHQHGIEAVMRGFASGKFDREQ
jgi:hypothetical protein